MWIPLVPGLLSKSAHIGWTCTHWNPLIDHTALGQLCLQTRFPLWPLLLLQRGLWAEGCAGKRLSLSPQGPPPAIHTYHPSRGPARQRACSCEAKRGVRLTERGTGTEIRLRLPRAEPLPSYQPLLPAEANIPPIWSLCPGECDRIRAWAAVPVCAVLRGVCVCVCVCRGPDLTMWWDSI